MARKTPKESHQHLPPAKKTQLARKPSGKRVGAGKSNPNERLVPAQPKPNPSAKANQRPPVRKSRWGGCLVTLAATAILIATGGMIAGGIRLGILLMIDPNAVGLLNRFLPSWTRISQNDPSSPKTLAAIQEEIRTLGLLPGTPVPLNEEGTNDISSALLLPVLALAPNCQTNCDKIAELRVYEPTQPKRNQKLYRLVHRLAITEPEEYFVLSSSVSTTLDNSGSPASLPLTKLSRFEDVASAQGIWLNVSGELPNEGSSVSYGQLIHYNPEQRKLSFLLQWSTPNGFQPYWQEVTGASTPELIINQTLGLEPQFQVYQIQGRFSATAPPYLEEISLEQPALDTQAYRDALTLANSGLWSPAWQWFKSQQKQTWSAAAQAQMDVIGLHAQFTQSQANQVWASPSQQILASLIDGRWADALLLFQTSANGAPLQEIAQLLKTDSERLWERVEAALAVSADESNVKAWGALILAAQQQRPNANLSESLDPVTWLQQLPQPQPADYSLIYELLARLNTAFAQISLTGTHLSQIVGSAQPVANIRSADWLQPTEEDWESGTPSRGLFDSNSRRNNQFSSPEPLTPSSPAPIPILQKEADQVWYQVQVTAFNDGQRWQYTPFWDLQLSTIDPARQLWKQLGLDTDSRIQITVWKADGTEESTMATVKAVSYRGGVLQLLAAGNTLPVTTPATGTVKRSLPLAHTEAAFRWLEPTAITLSELNNLQPQWVSVVLPALWQELWRSSRQLPGEPPSLPEMLQEMGHWSVRPIDLTGDNEPEAVIRVYEKLSTPSESSKVEDLVRENLDVPNHNLYRPRTLIFSSTGALLYSEFSQNASTSLTAIADLGDGGPAALVLNDLDQYSLKRWSAERQSFE